MGLLDNSLLASENTGATNELFLARWYVNEIALQLADAKKASNAEEAARCFKVAKKATNSHLGLMNRVINTKVGDPLELLWNFSSCCQLLTRPEKNFQKVLYSPLALNEIYCKLPGYSLCLFGKNVVLMLPHFF